MGGKGGGRKGKSQDGGKGGDIDLGGRFAQKPYKKAVEDVLSATKVKPSDFDQKAIYLLDYLHKNGARAPAALGFLKQAADGVERDDIHNSKAYVYALLRKFDEAAYKEMKAQSGGANAGKGRENGKGGKEIGAGAATAAASVPQRSQGDASSRQPVAPPPPPPLQDYLAQLGFFGGQGGQIPNVTAEKPKGKEEDLNPQAPEFHPGQNWGGRTPAAPLTAAPVAPAPYAPGTYFPGVPPYPTAPAFPYYAGYPQYPAAQYPMQYAVAAAAAANAAAHMPPPPPMSAPGATAAGGKKGKKDDVASGNKGKGKCGAEEGKGKRNKGDSKARNSKSDQKASGDAVQEDSAHPPVESKGSAGHEEGTCKPCAFYHTKGCSTGVDCQFCHMCGPGEKKKRKKDQVVPKPDGKDEDDKDEKTDAKNDKENEDANNDNTEDEQKMNQPLT